MKSIVAVSFGIVLRKLRVAAGFTQEQLGFKADLQRKYVSSLELGEKAPSLETVLKIASGLQMEAAELIALVCKEIHVQSATENV